MGGSVYSGMTGSVWTGISGSVYSGLYSNCKTHGKSLDVIDFVMYKEGCSKHEAILKCKALIGGSVPATPARNYSRAETMSHMFIYFKNAVHNSKPAQVYLQRRSLDVRFLEVSYIPPSSTMAAAGMAS